MLLALQADPNTPGALELKDRLTADVTATAAVTRGRPDSGLYDRAHAALVAGDQATGEQLLRQAIDNDERVEEGIRELLSLYERRGSLEMAVALLLRHRHQLPDIVEAQMNSPRYTRA